MQPDLQTKRLLLRPPAPGDAAAIAARINNRRVSATTARVPWPYDLDDARAFIDHALNVGPREAVYLITEQEAGCIGGIGFELGRCADAPELGYWLAEDWWHQGYATEAARAVTAHALTAKNHERLVARCMLGNEGSRRVLIAAGFRPAGIGFCPTLHAKGPVACQLFELTAREWRHLHEQNQAPYKPS